MTGLRLRFAPQGGRQWLAALGRLLALLVVLMSSLLALLQMPGSSFSGPLPRLSAEEERCAERLASHHPLQHVACDFVGTLCRGVYPKLGRELFQSAGATQG